MVAGMVMPRTDLRAIYELLFRDGVLVAKMDKRPQCMHPEVSGVSNLKVIRAMASLKSKGFVKETFAWRHCYWYLTNTGIVYLRDFLHLPPEIVPASLHRTRKPASMSHATSCYVSRPKDGQRTPEAPMDHHSYRRKKAHVEEAQRERPVDFRGGYRASGPTHGAFQRDEPEVDDGQARGLRSSGFERMARPCPPTVAVDRASVAAKSGPNPPLSTVKPLPPLPTSPPPKVKSSVPPPVESSRGLKDKKACPMEMMEGPKETRDHRLSKEGLVVETETSGSEGMSDVLTYKLAPESLFGQVPLVGTPEPAMLETPVYESLDKDLITGCLDLEIKTEIITPQEPYQDTFDSMLPSGQVTEAGISQEVSLEPIMASSAMDPCEQLKESVPQMTSLKSSSSPDGWASSREEDEDEVMTTRPDFIEGSCGGDDGTASPIVVLAEGNPQGNPQGLRAFVPADGAVGVEVEGHQVFCTCDYKPLILVLTTVPPHTDSLGVSTKTKAGLVTEDDPLPMPNMKNKKACPMGMMEGPKEPQDHRLAIEGLVVEPETAGSEGMSDALTYKLAPESLFGQVPSICTPEPAMLETPVYETLSSSPPDAYWLHLWVNVTVRAAMMVSCVVQFLVDSLVDAGFLVIPERPSTSESRNAWAVSLCTG
ncbi:hypothetical protein NFI96_002507 [Prochilodus magdalenae]|nr:hypothetical protein NFI96_002507 [Prochilodus magdalenae]